MLVFRARTKRVMYLLAVLKYGVAYSRLITLRMHKSAPEANDLTWNNMTSKDNDIYCKIHKDQLKKKFKVFHSSKERSKNIVLLLFNGE